MSFTHYAVWPERNQAFFDMKCERCNEANKGRYKTFKLQVGEKEFKYVMWCTDCLDTPIGSGKSDKQMWEHISTPYWLHMGLDLKPKEKAQLQYLKSKGMTWGEYAKAKYTGVQNQSVGYQQFNEHYNQHGRGNAPDASFRKDRS